MHPISPTEIERRRKLGALLKLLCKAHGLSTRALSEISGLAYSRLIDLKAGSARPRRQELDRLVSCLPGLGDAIHRPPGPTVLGVPAGPYAPHVTEPVGR